MAQNTNTVENIHRIFTSRAFLRVLESTLQAKTKKWSTIVKPFTIVNVDIRDSTPQTTEKERTKNYFK